MLTAIRLIRNCCSVACVMLLSGCSLPGILFYSNADPGLSLDRGEQVALHFFTKDPNYDSGVSLQAGQRYLLDVTILSYWIDSYIEENENEEPLDERGFANSQMPVGWLGMTRRSREHRWFELMLYQPDCRRDSLRGVTELSIDESSGAYSYTAACNGKLFLFVNDTHGFYNNNVGYANLSLARAD